MKMEVTKELIFDHFAKNTSPLQRKEIERWLLTRENEEQFYKWLEEWESNHLQYIAETELAAREFTFFLESNPEEEAREELVEEVTAVRRSFKWYWVAATILFVIAVSAGIFKKNIIYKTYETGYGEIARHILPDGSEVKLNTNSVLLVPRWGFGETSREVLLTGDASFSVKHTIDNKRFIVKTPKEIEVVVLGTEFTVYARKHFSKVILETGKVQLLYKEDRKQKGLVMKPGELVTFGKSNKPQLKTTQQANGYSEWEERRFVFEETTLEEIAYLLHENYGLTIDIKGEELPGRMLMGSFRANNVDELLQSISELLDISVVRQGNHVQLSDQ